MSDQAAPGWYPVDERTERWWDGIQWSEHQRPLGQGIAAPGAAPAVPYPYGGDAIQPVRSPAQSQAQPEPQPYQPQAYSQPPAQGAADPFRQPPQYFGQQAPYAQAPYGMPAPKRSVGRIIAAVVVAFLGVIFSIAALSNIASNAGDGARGIGYVIGRLLIPAALWTCFWFLVRRPRR
jgi:hypothetical protein